uniref:Cysteine synthase n=1 Tax=Eutreptiella gymnastica TaxID=73025 RepID=A0A7S1IIT1_9EUGL
MALRALRVSLPSFRTQTRTILSRGQSVENNAKTLLAAKYFEDNSMAIGRTPLVQLNRVPFGGAAKQILAKVEGRNPAYSVKCRIGASMIWDAEAKGLLRPGMSIVEPTSGNTGIALAFVAAARGYECVLTIPESMSIERRKVMKAYGAKIVLTEAALGMKGAIAAAEDFCKQDPNRYYMPQQFSNPANPMIHELTTGPEIWEATDGDVDVLVSGVGTGGTITGISRYFRSRGKPIHAVAVEPIHSPVLTQFTNGEELTPSPHKIQGIGAGFVPGALDLDVVDEIQTVDQDSSMEMARRLAMEEGLLVGISCGAAAHVAVELGKEPRFADKTIVVILPDAGERYLSTALYDSEVYKNLEVSKAGAGIL